MLGRLRGAPLGARNVVESDKIRAGEAIRGFGAGALNLKRKSDRCRTKFPGSTPLLVDGEQKTQRRLAIGEVGRNPRAAPPKMGQRLAFA
jgi:hypothetical protein